jgi:hypothetical protein
VRTRAAEWILRCGRYSLLLAVTFTVLGAYGYRQYSAAAARLDVWRSGRLAVTPIDASQSGEVQIDLPIGLSNGPHGVMVYLDPGATEPPSSFPRGEVVLSEEGSPPWVTDLARCLRDDQRDHNGYLLCWNRGSLQRTTRVTIRVVEGSPAWSGLRTVIYAKYWLCGLESVPVVLWALTACVAGLIAASYWGIITWRLAIARHGLPRHEESQSRHAEPSDAAESR